MLENLDFSGKVIAKLNPDTGELFTIGKKEDYCSVRVESSTLDNDEGFWTIRTRIATIRLKVELAEAMIAKGLLKDGKELPIKGKIIIRESFQPFYEEQEPKMNPKTKNVICIGHRPVFRQSIFTSNMDERDMFIYDYLFEESSTKVNSQKVKEAVPFEQFMGEQFPEPELVYDNLTI